MTRDWDLSTCSGRWDIYFYILGDFQDPTSTAAALANISKALGHLCRQPFGKSNITVRIVASFNIELERRE